MPSDEQSNGEHAVAHVRISVLAFRYNHETHQVTIGGEPMPLSLAQMIAGEGLRQLEEQRRIASVQLLRQQLSQAEQDAQIAAALRRGR